MFGLMLGDDAWTAEITKKSKAKEGSEFARLMLAGAKIATSEKEERAAAVREAAAMFKTENAANKNAFFSIMIVGDLAADELKQIQAAVAGYKDDALPRMVKGAITEKTAAAILPDKLNKPFALADKLADGGDFTTESMKGKVVLVDFWATWCGPCMEAMPDVEEMYKKYHADGLEVVGVSSDKDPADLKQFMEKRKTAPWPQMFDANKPGWHRFVEELGIDGIPRMLLIDRKGILRSIHAHEVMAEMIPKLLAEK
ncbi:MAG: TlpA family protein disulfide reductase [Planctomycetes bacterium]|nr:TlpA family protein disulfide reductase [Planctomycetota bacterium]